MATANSDVANKNVCLILLIGLPGSGKTFLTNFLVNHFRSATFVDNDKSCFSNLCVVPVTYDDYVTYDDEFTHIKDWKQKRKIIFSSVEELVLGFKDNERPFNENLFIINNTFFCSRSQFIGNKNLFIIVDDNMYYKSMRYEYYKLAKKYEISFCQIYLDTTLENALQYNRRRASNVPETVIYRMNKKIEIPNPGVNNWERNSLVIPAFKEFDDKSILDKLHNIIASAILSPEKYKNNLSLNTEECKAITDTNLLHQIDIKFRSLINIRIKEIKQKQSYNKNEIKSVAEKLNNLRLQVMKDIKSGVLTLPYDLVNILQCANKTVDDDSFVNNYLLNMFIIDADSIC